MQVHILALETSTSVCGVALLSLRGETTQLYVRRHEGSSEHAEFLLPMVEEVLAEAGVKRHEISAIAFGQGPGGFTGLRVACGVTQGLAFALGCPVVPIPSLLAVADALEKVPGQLEVVALDARMQELYVAAYRYEEKSKTWACCYNSLLIDAQVLPDWLTYIRNQENEEGTIRVSGDALVAFPDLVANLQAMPSIQLGDTAKPDVEAVAHLGLRAFLAGEGIAAELAAPSYVRDKVAFTTAEREQGLGGNPAAAWRPA
ncbi:tRNA (adenosine(37)-N6)-threonylcarbamoyltransferase complex dimerization subunit type 1 TsaB [Paenalcaligenes sp. Me131]|uniref:tRNA (adenosine(37)-N6)-threonylcarbamoyltransferase complex dimerization subunit type 1 TsaB n=1 Tax=Paenalcaligenes sp. Me131 TaxID=3392636 RepID=UPI003D2E052D